MQSVKGSYILFAETMPIQGALEALTTSLGVPEDFKLEAANPGELVAEVAGRLCYKSFGTELNANLTKVREGNKEYIENILKQKHGSVLEHCYTTVIFFNVSRIFTHELVRHRAGMGFSQESMRFVRLDNIPMYIPDLTQDFSELAAYASPGGSSEDNKIWGIDVQQSYKEAVIDVTLLAERKIREFTKYLDSSGVPFALKKKITSALRRMAPSGHTTNIMVTANHRAWRYIFGARTSAGAEEEMQILYRLGSTFKWRYPAFYQDAIFHTDSHGHHEIVFTYEKV